MSRHQHDLVMCMKQQGAHLGYLCNKCSGRCPICDSHNISNELLSNRPLKQVRICESCSFGKLQYSCVICGNKNESNHNNVALYCYECSQLERNKDGCPKIINIGSNKIDKHFELKE